MKRRVSGDGENERKSDGIKEELASQERRRNVSESMGERVHTDIREGRMSMWDEWIEVAMVRDACFE